MTEAISETNPESMTPVLHVAPGPHIASSSLTTRKMMIDVLIGLSPLVAVSIIVFHWYAVVQIGICVVSCVAAEALFLAMRRKPITVTDCSAAVTGVILALSLPGTAPWHVGVIGSFVAIGLAKVIFGGLGHNIFNPAMVGRAFVMMAFPALLGAGAFVSHDPSATHAMTQATPMTVAKAVQAGKEVAQPISSLWELFWGNTNGCLGETSAFACIVGGLYLCLRRTASWQIPAGAVIAAAILAGAFNLANLDSQWTVAHQLLGGALLFGAFFIATDPVSSPLTHKGKWIFGAGTGALVILMRQLSAYPEGVMFSVLIMNATVPLINRWTIPRPVGGKPATIKK